MLLILAHHHDAEAKWLYDKLLAETQLKPILLMPEALGIDYDVTLQLSNNGRHHASILFYNPNFKIQSEDITYTINRLSYVDPLIWKNASKKEQLYATNELNAFFPAFLHALPCPVSNPAHNGALGGETVFSMKWTSYFLSQNVPVHPVVFDSPDQVYHLLQKTPQKSILRFIQIGNELITQNGQLVPPGFEGLKEMISHNREKEMAEFIYLIADDEIQLLTITKTPCLSLYSDNITGLIFKLLTSESDDTISGNTQRNTTTVVG